MSKHKNKLTSAHFIQGMNFHGDLNIDGDLIIDGTIIGSVRVDGKVTLGETGIIQGNLSANFADISGSIKGILVIEEVLKVNAPATIDGDIYAGGFECSNGAQLEGKLNIGLKWKEITEDGQEENIKPTYKENSGLTEREEAYTKGKLSGEEFFSNED